MPKLTNLKPKTRLTNMVSEEINMTDQPNIFQLYESNIGIITPIMADILREAEKEYPYEWIEKAVTIAITRNVRNWKYVEAILRRWQACGMDNGLEKRDMHYSDDMASIARVVDSKRRNYSDWEVK